ncbi:MAG: bifunctional oligoribonuclease/PAP phosphatase NrnA [Desulfobacterales bacterium]
MKQIIQNLRKSNHILLASHINPDGDSIGSLTALGLALESCGKEVTLYSESAIPAVYRFLSASNRISKTLEAPEDYETAVVLDCSDFERVGKAADKIKRVPVIINIDHHTTNTNFGHIRFVDMWACATAELVYLLIKEMKIPMTKAMATSIYTGILTDTGSFRFSNTNENAFSICKEMVEFGVDPSYVAQHVYGPYSLGRLKLLNRALDSIELSEKGHISIMTLTRDMYTKTMTRPEDTDGFLNYARNIKDVKIAALIQQKQNGDGDYHVSLRSDGSVDVASIAAEFGGGGHRTAAGFCIDLPLTDVKEKIFQLAKRILPEVQ